MSEVQEQSGLANISFKRGEQPIVAEEPTTETPEVAQEETPQVEEPQAATEEPQEAQTPEATTEETPAEEPKVAEPTVSEDGFVQVSLGEETTEQPKTNDLTEQLKALQAQNEALLAKNQELENRSDLDPRAKKLDEWFKNGGDLTPEIWELQNKDYSSPNLNDTSETLSLLQDKLRYIDGFDTEEIKYHISKNFPALSGKIDVDDYDDAELAEKKNDEKMALRMEVKRSLSELKEFQQKALIPEVNHNKQQEYEQAVNLYRAEATAKFDEVQDLDIDLAEIKLRFQMRGDANQFARSIITEPENQANFWRQRYVKEDGTTDYALWKREMYELENRQEIYKSILAQGKSLGKKELLEEMESNPTSKSSPTPTGEPKAKSGLAAISFNRKTF